MPTVPLYFNEINISDTGSPRNALPNLLQTPSGLAILEIQGTIHAPFPDQAEEDAASNEVIQTSVGRIEFPLYDPQAASTDTKWMKRVYLYVGKHQRLTGEVKKLPKALVVVNKSRGQSETNMDIDGPTNSNEELEILEVIKHKIIFGGRPEPVGE